MRLLVIHTRHFPPRGFHAITLFPFVFYRGAALNESDRRHETVHLWQQAVLLVLPFYLLYLLFWLFGLLCYRDSRKAYMSIPFERSAYALQSQSKVSPLLAAFDWLHHLRSNKVYGTGS